jgi:serpin B
MHHTLGASLRTLEGRALSEGEDGEDPVVVSLTASIWDLRGERVPEPLYGAALHEVTGDLGAIRTVMNCVIEAQSHGLLVDFLPASIPATDTTSIDLDVAFLQAPWAQGLADRGPQPFTRDDGMEVMLPSMGEDISAGWYEDAELTAVDVPLRGGALSVLLVLPAVAGDLEAFTTALDADTLAAVRAGSSHEAVSLQLPKLDLPSETFDYYEPLGFDCELYTLRRVLHGAAVQMDEHGVKAAAATAAESWDSGAPEFYWAVLDRPFLFFVYDEPTGFVLYSGRFAG